MAGMLTLAEGIKVFFFFSSEKKTFLALLPGAQLDQQTKPDVRPPPPLEALGGWTGADWFSASVLSDEDVVGFTRPKLGDVRKQSFRLVERSAADAGGAAAQRAVARRPSLSARLGQILDAYGVTRAAAFGRTRLLFDPAPTLFFAEVPLSRIKMRAANKLRQALIQNALRGCVLQIGRAHAVLMLWPWTEAEITRFVDAAAPPQPMHPHFDKAEDDDARRLEEGRRLAGKRQEVEPPKGGRRAKGDDALGPRERQRLQSERNALLQQVNELRAQIDVLRKSQTALGAMEQLGLDDARLKSMLRLLHPDKHGGSEAANDAAKWINGLRDILKSSAGS
jgi:hypothetical protein